MARISAKGLRLLRYQLILIVIVLTLACGKGDALVRFHQACSKVLAAEDIAETRDEQFALRWITEACTSSATTDQALRLQLGTVCQNTHVIWTMANASGRALAAASKRALLEVNALACADDADSLYAIARNGEALPVKAARREPSPRREESAVSKGRENGSVPDSPELFSAFGPYRYSYKRSRERVVALYLPKMLPRNDVVLIGAMKQLIVAAFGDSVDAASPEIVPGPKGNLIRLANERSSYDFLIVKEDTGEVHSLIVSRLAR